MFYWNPAMLIYILPMAASAPLELRSCNKDHVSSKA